MLLRRRPAVLLAAAVLAGGLPCLGAGAATAAGVGGASPDGPTPGALPTGPVPTGAALAIGTPVATSSSDGVTISTSSAVLLRRRASITGVAPARAGGIAIETLDARGRWTAVAQAAVGRDGSFTAAWRPRALGAQQLRAVAAGGSAADDGGSAPQVAVTVYAPAIASWFSPGTNDGAQTACGVPLRKTTLGVAHKTLPCGTRVEVLYRGRTLVVPVIDRGPFIAGRTWDLTKAAHDVLGGLDGLVTIGARTRSDLPRLKTRYAAPAIRGS